MAALSAVRAALAARLRTITGLTVHDRIPTVINPPAAVIAPNPGVFARFDTSETTDDLQFVVALYVAAGDDLLGQAALDAYLAGDGPRSVRATIAADPTLDGTVEWAVVTEARNYGTVEGAGMTYFGCELAVTAGVPGGQ